MNEKLKPCCGKCVNYMPIVCGIDHMQLHKFCIEHQCHVDPKSNGCKDYKEWIPLLVDSGRADNGRARQSKIGAL